jgi:hypothetical protein
MENTKYVQTLTKYLAGAGTIIGATSITLTDLTDIYGNVLTMADFGVKGYITLEPNTTNEESATFTGITANVNTTYTLTGVSSGLAQSPYTEASGLVRQHSGGTQVVITDTVQFWNTFPNKNNDSTIAATYTFTSPNYPRIDSVVTPPVDDEEFVTKKYVDDIVISGSPDASNSTKGITKLSVAAVTPTDPIAVGDNDPRVPTQAENDALAGTSGIPSSTNPYVTQNDTTNGATITDTSIAFVDSNPDTITDSNNGFVTAGFQAGQTITVSGSVSNNNTFTIASVVAGTITLVAGDSLTAESAGATVTITAATIGKVVRYSATSQVKVPLVPVEEDDAASKSYVDTQSQTIDTTNYVLGESFTGATTPQACYVLDDLYQFGLTNISSANNSNGFGMASGSPEIRALRIIPRANVSIASIRLQLAKVGTPSDNAFIEIQTDTAGSPSGTPVTNGTSGTQSGVGLSSTAATEVNLTFTIPPSLITNTTYWVVFKRSSTLDSTNYYVTGILNDGLEYGSFAGKTFVSGAWSTSSTNGNIPFAQLYTSSGKSQSLWLTDSDSTQFMPRQFYGFCTTTGSAGATATIVKSGVLDGFSGLSIGSDYTTSSTPGNVTNSGGGVYIGTAISATEINIPKIKYGDSTGGSGSTVSLIGGYAISGQPLTSAPFRYKLPFNGNFMHVWDTSGSGINLFVYAGNVASTYDLIYTDSNLSGGDCLSTFPYTRGQYINVQGSTTGGQGSLRFTPIIE